MKVKIVADNCCDLPEKIIEQYHIDLVHLLVRFGDHEYQPGEISNAEFYHLMESSPLLPSTTQPPVEELVRVYSDALADGSQVVAVHFSSGISGTCQGAQLARKMLDNERLTIFDSRKASVGCGLLALEAARLADQGAGLNDIMAVLEGMRNRMQCIFTVGRMEYLIRGGRISRAKGSLADILDIKPILHFDQDGYIMPLDKARGHKAALRKILDIMQRTGKELTQQTIGISHAQAPDTAAYLAASIQERFNPREIVIGDIGPVIGAHVGLGTWSVFFQT